MPASAAGAAGAASPPPPPPPPPPAMKRELAFALQSLSEISASPGRTRSGRADPAAAAAAPQTQAQPRAMKRELAFALQSLSEICASPGRTRSGRSISHPDPSSAASLAAAAKRRKRSTEAPPAAADLVSPPTPPIDDEPPKPSPPLLDPSDGSNAPTATDGDQEEPSAAAEVVVAQHVVEQPQPLEPSHPLDSAPLVIAEPDVPVEDCAAAVLDAAPALTNAAGDGKSNDQNGGIPPQQESDNSTNVGTPLLQESDNPNGGTPPLQESDNLNGGSPPQQESDNPNGGNQLLQESDNPNGGNQLLQESGNPNGGAPPLQETADNALLPATPLVIEDDPATPAAAAAAAAVEPRPARRFTRSQLKNKPDEGEAAAARQSQATPEDASMDSALPLDIPQRRFTRSQLKPKVEVCPNRTSVESEDSASDSPPSVKKMEMKMSKKVACLTKHPGNIRELLNTGLLEGMPVMYLIPHSRKAVLKGVVNGCNIRCFCSSCNGSKVVSAYYFEQHAGSTKKHPADYIYLRNGNSLRDVLRASERSPLEDLEETLRSSIDPVVKMKRVSCLNCNEPMPPSSQTEGVLCCGCLESMEHQDTPTPSYACKSNSSLTPGSKNSLVKKISSIKKDGSAGKVTNKDTGLHKLVFNVLLDGTEVAYYVDGQRKVDGYIKDQRIYCNHCNRVVSPSAFEAHAGEGSRRKPYDNIFTSNGVSLHELSMKISKDMGRSERETDDLCRECGQGGDIFPCTICPRSFHPACVGLCEVPSEWYCDNCRNLVQKEKALAENKNAKAAGRQAGVDSIEQIMKRAIRIVPISDDLGGCALCKQKDFNNAVFDERTVILCDQCEKEYHVGCLRSQLQVDLKELPEGEWFCSSSCSEIRSSLDKIISDGAQVLQEPDMDIIRKKHEMRDLCIETTTDLRWHVLSGKSATEDGKLLLSAAVPIFHQSFDPIIEALSGRDLIPEMVNGRRPKDGMPGQDYSGMYCVLLTLGTAVVSAALLRVMGREVAELPLVATSRDLQGLGYFQALFSCIERMLSSLKVKHFMLPAAHEAEEIWVKKFGFSRIPQEQLEAYLNGAHLTIFHGTANLYKAVQLS